MQRTALDPCGGMLTTVAGEIASTTVPPGETWVFTYAIVTNEDGAAAAMYQLWVTNGTTTLPIASKNSKVDAGVAYVHLEGPEMPLPAGWRLRGVASANGDVSITLFGYKLTPDPVP